MKEEPRPTVEPSPEQIRYASVLEIGMYVGLACLFVTFALYVLGVVKPYIPVEELSEHWTKNVDDYLDEAGIKAGWSWVTMLRYGDFINFVSIALLAGVTVLCYSAIVPLLLKRKDTLYAVLAMLEVVVLVAAASGFGVGH